MDKAIDIYAKLIVAVISFIAPLILHLLSFFKDGIELVKRNSTYQQNTLDELKDKIGEDIDVKKLIAEKKKTWQRSLNLLDPKRQIKRIYPYLFASLILLMVYYIVQEKAISENVWCKGTEFSCLTASLICAVIGVVRLKIVTWSVIDVRNELAKETAKRTTPEAKKLKPNN